MNEPYNPAAPYGTLYWDSAGNPYMYDGKGIKRLIPPIVAAGYQTDPRAQEWARQHGAVINHANDPGPGDAGIDRSINDTSVPEQSFFKNRGQWDDQSGQYNQDTNWNNILSLAAAGGIGAAGASAAGAFGGAGAGGSAASQTAAPTIGAGATTSTTASAPVIGASTAGELGPSTAANIAGTSAATGGATVPPALAGPVASGGSGMLANLLTNPNFLTSAVTGGLGLAGSILETNAQRDQAQANAAYQQQVLAQQQKQFEASQAENQRQFNATDVLNRQKGFLDSTQQNPVTQQNDFFKSALVGQLANQGPVQLGQPYHYDLSGASKYLSDPALQQAASRFYQGQNQLNPGVNVPNYKTAGFGGSFGQPSYGQGSADMATNILQNGQPNQPNNNQRDNGIQDYFNRVRGLA